MINQVYVKKVGDFIMATVRFSLVEVALRALETETWLRMVSECFGIRMSAKSKRLEGMAETKWEVTLKQQQDEVKPLYHHAIHKLIPMAGTHLITLLDSVSQAGTIYAPEEAEAVYSEGNKMIEEINGHISGILYNASKMREANRQINKMEDAHMKAVMYHNSVMPYMDTLRFHTNRLNQIMQTA